VSFPALVVAEAWKRSGGRCECTRESHQHQGGRCARNLIWTMQGAEGGPGWTAARKTSWGTDVLGNCEIRCTACQGPQVKPAE
jgi:hypothetical protein